MVLTIFAGIAEFERAHPSAYRRRPRRGQGAGRAIRQATKVSRHSSGILHALGTSLSDAERQYLDEVLTSRDGNEGIAAFLERRKPAWEDL